LGPVYDRPRSCIDSRSSNLGDLSEQLGV
jgi:hypothetical protein